METARKRRALVARVAIVVAVLGAWIWATPAAADVIPFTKVQLFIEYNATDNDAGVQAFFDGDAWKVVRITSPEGRRIFEVNARGALRRIGLTELVFESEEPSLDEVLAEFPAGAYVFSGKTVEGDTLIGIATLSHDLPAAPVILGPDSSGTVDPANTVITWSPMTGIARIQLIVEQEDLGVSLTVDLPASATSFKVPPEFLQADTEYAFEILAIAANGNRTIAESSFTTEP